MKEKTESNRPENPILELTEQTLKSCEQAIRNGLKLQEETARRWSEIFTQTTPSAQDWQKRLSSINAAAKDLAPMTQKHMEEMVDLVNKNSKIAADLMKKTSEAVQAASMAERQTACKDLWTASSGAVRTNAETLMQINNHLVDSWVEFIQKATEPPSGRATQAA